MTDFQTVRLEHRDGVTQIELCRPEILNRFDMPLHRELSRVLTDLGSEEEVRAVVLVSTGRVFSAGGDTAVMLEAAGDLGHRLSLIDEGRRLFRAAADFPKPLVVGLHANSYGLGTSVIMTADAIVSAPGVELSDPHVVMGLAAGDGGCVAWPSAMGMVRAKRHLLTGDPLTAELAFQLGVVTDLVDTAEDVRPAAMALATKMASLPPIAVQMTKRALNKALMARSDEVLDTSFYLEAITFGSQDLLEAVAAFKEKRTPHWQGK
jgi:enoyl-CoA hydratase